MLRPRGTIGVAGAVNGSGPSHVLGTTNGSKTFHEFSGDDIPAWTSMGVVGIGEYGGRMVDVLG